MEKHRRARSVYVYDERGRARLDAEALIADYERSIGVLQSADESRPVPVSAVREMARSVPSALAAIARDLFSKQGTLKNEYVAVEGPGGIGKSTFAKLVAYIHDGVVVYDVDELVAAMTDAVVSGKWYPVLVLDDVAAMISKYWVFTRDRESLKGLFQAVELSKDWAGVVILTARSFEGVAKRFRELSTLRGEIKRLYVHGGYIIDYIEWRKPDSRVPVYIDYLWPGLRMPESEWRRMMAKRREKLLELLEGLRGGGGADMQPPG